MMPESIDLSGRPITSTRLDENLFVDRGQELRLTIESVRRRSNVLILGRRGTGKTSFLSRVARDLERDGLRAIMVSAATATTLDELVTLIRRGLRRYELLGPGSPDRAAPTDIISEIQSLQPQVELEREIVILLDEIGSAELPHTLFGRLRDEVWNLPYTWVVADEDRNRLGYLTPPADAFFGTAIELGDFSLHDAVEALRRRVGSELDDAVLTEIAKVAGGNPRALLTLARDVLVRPRDRDEVLGEHLRRQAAVAELGVPAARVVQYIENRGPVSASDREFLDQLGWTRNRATQVLNELERQGFLVSQVKKGGRKKVFALPPAEP
jgi:hypothetical protein